MSKTSRTSHKRKYKEVSEADQKAIVSEYQRNEGIKALAKRFHRHPATIEHIIKRSKSNNGNSVTPRAWGVKFFQQL